MSSYPFTAVHVLTVIALTLSAAGCKPGVVVGGDSDKQVVESTPPADDSDVPVDTGCPGDTTTSTWYPDADDDGFGDAAGALDACEAPDGYVRRADDCDDADPNANPDGREDCNGKDDDCNGSVDDAVDLDRDGYTSASCAGDDCDDGDEEIYPTAPDSCGDGIDSDCDGEDLRCSYDGDLAHASSKLYAEGNSDDAGRHMDVGDLNADGVEDAVVGAMWAYGYQGSAWVVMGPVPSGTSTFGDAAYELVGGSGSYEGGRTVGIGDVNGDDFDDVMLGAPDSAANNAVIFFGPVGDDLTFSEAEVRASCDSPVECGHGGDVADVDGDGTDDAIIGAGEDRTGGYYSGSVYLNFGPLTEESIKLRSDSDAELVGASVSSETGRVITAGGDVDGDGVEDMLITASYDSEGGPYSGAVHVVLGPVTGDMLLADSDGKLLGAGAYDYAGEALAMGDISGDGLCDAVVGAYAGAGGAGTAYASFGPATGTLSLTAADVTISGTATEGMGVALASRDIDGDGIADLMAGAGTSTTGGYGAGTAYQFYGPLAGALRGADANTAFLGEDRDDAAGTGVGLGDMDGNGELDILVGATAESTGGPNSGAWYVVLTGVE